MFLEFISLSFPIALVVVILITGHSDFKKTSSETYGNLRKQETKEHDILGSINKIKSSLKVNKTKITIDSNM